MKKRSRPSQAQTNSKGWVVLIVVATVLLPLSPVLAFAAIFIGAFLYDKIGRAYAEWYVKTHKSYREVLEEELQKRKQEQNDLERTE